MKSMRYLLVIVIGLAASTTCSFALWPFKDKAAEPDVAVEKTRGGPSVVKRYHLHIPDKKTEGQLLELFKEKKRIGEDLKALKRFDQQKRDQYTAIQNSLMGIFSVLPESRYEFDAETKTIYELIPKNDEEEMTEDAEYERQVHRTLENDIQIKRFKQLTQNKKTVHKQLRTFQSVLGEKTRELAKVDNLLADKFSLSKEQLYQYDESSMVLYELVSTARRPNKRR